ncbi:hypothetical protein [Halotia branconii]|uniref:Uncharacterized protein n=1 Tax=Halotia branconii CENA392 TaxID=1539056 RepID=A0AAJ6NYI7_9CYAN|nr:hypothetical protein [Halotia branconii]WGV29104.1 hypothetical protein QI031_30330 [Halotia branconii CENA392]
MECRVFYSPACLTGWAFSLTYYIFSFKTLENMELIKKSQRPIIKKPTTPEPLQQNPVDEAQPITEQPVATEDQAREYIPGYVPVFENPPVQSVSNSGWQVSDIWKDIRVDAFYD